MIKGSIQEENITFINIYVPNTEAAKYIKKILTDIKGETDKNTIIVGDFNTPLASMHRASRQKISKEMILDQLDLIDIYKTFHLKTAEYTFFSSACGTFSKIEHMLSHKTSLNLREMKSYQASFLTTML